MKTSELIRKLNVLIVQHGDKDIYRGDGEGELPVTEVDKVSGSEVYESDDVFVIW